jgi:cell division septation protein DedD
MMLRIAFSCSLMALPASAQQLSLRRADSLLIAGDYERARTTVAEWQRANPTGSSTDPNARAHALYLAARLTTDATKAGELYLSLALSHPTAPDTPDALLRLGQGLLAGGEASRAVNYLERLVMDYPAATSRAQAQLWLARAQLAAGNAIAACNIAEAALGQGVSDPEISAAIRDERKAACANPGAPAPSVVTTPSNPANAPAASSDQASGRYALQTGAYLELDRALSSVAELRRLGYDARIVYVGDSSLARVRIGRFAQYAAASAELSRLLSAGIRSIVVEDATRERVER